MSYQLPTVPPPKGWRYFRPDEVSRKGDKVFNINAQSAAPVELSVGQKETARTHMWFIRRISKTSKPHRFDGMTLVNVHEALWNDWRDDEGFDSEDEFIAPRFAAEVRRRDRLKGEKK